MNITLELKRNLLYVPASFCSFSSARSVELSHAWPDMYIIQTVHTQITNYTTNINYQILSETDYN